MQAVPAFRLDRQNRGGSRDHAGSSGRRGRITAARFPVCHAIKYRPFWHARNVIVDRGSTTFIYQEGPGLGRVLRKRMRL